MKNFRKYKIISFLSAMMFFGCFKIVAANWFTSLTGIDALLGMVGNVLLFISSIILWLAGVIFNFSISYTLNFKDLVASTGVVNIGWEVFRDLSNMIFIFILLVISIATILGIQSYNAKTLLTKVIWVALLINFSLFTTSVIIDSSNVLALGFYNATTKDVNTEGVTNVAKWDKGISSIFAQALNLGSIYDQTAIKKRAGEPQITNNNVFTIAFFGSIVLLITAFVFFAAAILFIVRAVVLMFLMMTSPLAFLGMILPATQSYSKQWWDTLFKQAFFAPLYLAFIYVVAKGITSPAFQDTLTKSGNTEAFSNTFTGGGSILIIFNFILIIGLMIASLVTAIKLGAYGADAATKFAGKAAFGTIGKLGRETVGRGFNKMAGSKIMQDWAAKGGGTSKLALKTMRGVGDASFDVRNIKSAQNIQDIKIGEGVKGGYTTHFKEIEKERTAFGKSLKGDTGRMVATGRVNPVTGAPIMRAVSRTEAYGQSVQDRSVMSILTGTTAANKKAGENLVKEFTHKRDLKEAKKDLKVANDRLKDWRKVPTTPTADIDAQRIVISDAEDKINDLNEKIRKLTATT
ncbi:MAG: hypothetical protein ABIG87_00420 [Patescibacteria group bacterium]